MKRMDRLHPAPLPYPACFYQGDGMYPERIRQSFSNGQVQTYWAEVKMPPPNILREKERERMTRQNGGYLYREAKKRGGGNALGRMVRWFRRGDAVTVEHLKAVLEAREAEIERLEAENARLRAKEAERG